MTIFHRIGLVRLAQGFMKYRPVYLMVSLLLLLGVYPAFSVNKEDHVMLSALFTIFLISAILSVWRKRRPNLWLAVLLGVPWVVLDWVDNYVLVDTALGISTISLQVVFLLFILIRMLIETMTTWQVTINTICRAVSGYLLLGITWAAVYVLMADVHPDAFWHNIYGEAKDLEWPDSIYYSFVTLTTLGYGDITPRTPFARSLSVVEAVIGPMYLTILIARLVAIYSSGFRQQQSEPHE